MTARPPEMTLDWAAQTAAAARDRLQFLMETEAEPDAVLKAVHACFLANLFFERLLQAVMRGRA